ncbi:MAG TPA: TonB-dependent receptor [Melioribacteraceae bacterium]|nr:TonB-dependent receptor [Melioribacteraceae bacterium]
MYFKFVFIYLLFISTTIFSQNLIGFVFEQNNGNKIPLSSANVYWEGTNVGVATKNDGSFSIPKAKSHHAHLIISYIGYKPAKLEIEAEDDTVEVILSLNRELNEIVVTAARTSKYVDNISPLHKEVLTSKELVKAACCNLGESFTTNATVDVQYQDAVTGARQIQMLGLAGLYSQILFENIPLFNGLGKNFGLGFIPGPWISEISISKGSASVVNGYESISGQINMGFKKPTDEEKYYLNIFQSSHLKTDINANYKVNLSEHLSTLLLVHSDFNVKKDDNKDNFTDQPKTTQFNIFNRWKYDNHENFESDFGFNLLTEKREAGQMNVHVNPYKINIESNRFMFYAKNGYIFNQEPYTSLGTIISGQFHEQKSNFGNTIYNAKQNTLNAKLIFETETEDEIHHFILGSSFSYSKLDENLNLLNNIREESIPGIFVEYNFMPNSIFTFVPGARVDFHNLYGTFFTPRAHAKLDITDNTTLRASVGKGFRTVNIIADNTNFLPSSRTFEIIGKPSYEESVNYGFNLTQYFTIAERDLMVTADYYHINFIKQTIVDLDTDINKVMFYELNGNSYSNTYQVELSYELFPRLQINTAYRYTDVKMQIGNNVKEKPLLSRYKVLLTLSYATKDEDWLFDASFLVNGPGRIPSTQSNPEQFRKPETFKSFLNINAQITKKIDYFEFYVGGENLTNYKQSNPIIDAGNPFGDYFDSSLIYGPIDGRKFYAGIRISVN